MFGFKEKLRKGQGVIGTMITIMDNPDIVKILQVCGFDYVIIDHAKYAPLGHRGVSMLRPHAGYESVPSVVDYMKKTNEDTIILCQIESTEGVDNVDAILAVDGVDAVFIGPNDLSQSYGLMGQFDHPAVVGAIEAVAAAAVRAGKHSGIHIIGPTANLRKWIDKGMTVNLWSNEIAMMMTAAREGLSQLRAPAAERERKTA